MCNPAVAPGIVMGKSFEEETEAQMLKVIKVNVMGPMYLQKLVYNEMRENDGHIVNISSLAGIVAGKLIRKLTLLKFL